MAGFQNVGQYVDAHVNGAASFCSFRKIPSQASVSGWWVDLSMAAGNPVPNYYASEPLVAAVLSSFRGIFHGDDKSPYREFLTSWALMTPTAALVGRYKVMDYLLYYPFIDLDSTDEQVLDNTVVLPRYTDGVGVRAMLVAAAPTTGGGTFTYNYINQDGVSKTSPIQSLSVAAASIASIATSEQATVAGGNIFLTMASGDTGIRSITSVTMLTPGGGLGALVLVYPLADLAIREINTQTEIEFVRERMPCPRVYDGAYLGMIVNCAGSVAAGILTGNMRFAWN